MKKYTHLSLEQRYKIEALLATPTSKREIAKIIGVHVSTVYREIRRNSTRKTKAPDKYQADAAHDFSKRRAYKSWSQKTKNPDIRRRIFWLLERGWSPEQIAETCKRRKIQMLSTEAIYQLIYVERKKGNDLTGYLRRHRRRRKRRLDKQPRVIIKNKVSIHDRPQIIGKQKRVGDFEIDLVKCKKGYLLTITERKTPQHHRKTNRQKSGGRIRSSHKSNEVLQKKGLFRHVGQRNGVRQPRNNRQTTELAMVLRKPYKSQQHNCNESQNGLIREYFKRDTDLTTLTQRRHQKYTAENKRQTKKEERFYIPV